MASGTLNLLAKHRGAVLVASVANTASLLFGYDTGVAGSVIALQRSVSPTRLPSIVVGRSLGLTEGFTASHPSLNTRPVFLRRLMSLPISLRY